MAMKTLRFHWSLFQDGNSLWLKNLTRASIRSQVRSDN